MSDTISLIEEKNEGIITVTLSRLRSALLILCSALSVFFVSANSIVSAATATKTVPSSAINNNANSLKLSPLRTDLTLDPAKSGVVKTYVTNLTGATIVLKAIENDFVSGDEKGTPSIILDENSYAPSHSLKRFMAPISNVTISAGATQEVDVHVNVPKNAQAGGYYGVIRFAPAGTASQQVALSSSVASLILLTVSGPAVERLSLTNFDVQQNGGTATNFRTPENLQILVRFMNQGNIHEAPFGQINVQKGKKVIYTYNFNQDAPRDEILPDSSRRWQVPLKNLGKFGKYTISGTFGYGAKGQTVNIQKTVWIIPSTVILAIVIAIVVIAAIGLGLWMFLRNYKRRILKSSRRRY